MFQMIQTPKLVPMTPMLQMLHDNDLIDSVHGTINGSELGVES
jgi:hypothetical protein